MKKVFLRSLKRVAQVKVIGNNIENNDVAPKPLPVYVINLSESCSFILTAFKKKVFLGLVDKDQFDLMDSFNWKSVSNKEVYIGFRYFEFNQNKLSVTHLTVFDAIKTDVLEVVYDAKLKEVLHKVFKELLSIDEGCAKAWNQNSIIEFELKDIETRGHIWNMKNILTSTKLVGLANIENERKSYPVIMSRVTGLNDRIIIDVYDKGYLLIKDTYSFDSSLGFINTQLIEEFKNKDKVKIGSSGYIRYLKAVDDTVNPCLCELDCKRFEKVEEGSAKFILYKSIIKGLYKDLQIGEIIYYHRDAY